MTFFHDLNKRLAELATKQDAKQITESTGVAESKFSKLAKEIGKNPKVKNPAAVAATIGREKYGQKAMTAKSVAGRKHHEEMDETSYSAKAARAGKDIGKPGKNFAKIAKGAAERYGSKAAGERVAGAVLNKLRHPTNEGTCPSCHCNPCECVEEGNAFTGKLKATPKGEKFKLGNKEFTDTSDLEEGFEEMHAWLKQREKEKGTGKFDVKDTGYSKRYTRKHEDDEEKDDEAKSDEPKRRGRPKGKAKGPERVTKGAWKHKGERKSKVKENEVPLTDRGEYDDEAGMTKDSLHTIVRHAKELESALRSNENLPEWVQEKIGQIKGMMSSVTDYIISTHERDVEQHTGREGITMDVDLDEKAVSVAQRRAAGIAHAAQKGEIPKSKLRGASKEMAKMAQGELHKFAATKEKGLPKHVKEAGKPDFLDLDKDGNKTEPMKTAAKQAKSKKKEEVEETTVAGSVATAGLTGKSSKGGMQFGKGVYESFNTSVEKIINESIAVEHTMSECGEGEMSPGITIQASGEDAAKLMMLLKLAGLGESSCPTCGRAPCGCGQELDENSPDWPTNTETLDADPNLRTYSGGLNGPKSTGQSTTIGGGLPNLQARRQASMEESVELERNLFKTWKNYKG